MSVHQKNNVKLVTKEGFHAVGLKWKGTFAEAGAGGIRVVHTEMHNRLNEIKHVVNSEILLGLSYHDTPDHSGFTHYAVVEVERIADVPPGMISLSVPTLTYATYEHKKGQNIVHSYNTISAWIKTQGYKEHHGNGLTHFEKYPMSMDPYTNDPEFTIMIPVVDA